MLHQVDRNDIVRDPRIYPFASHLCRANNVSSVASALTRYKLSPQFLQSRRSVGLQQTVFELVVMRAIEVCEHNTDSVFEFVRRVFRMPYGDVKRVVGMYIVQEILFDMFLYVNNHSISKIMMPYVSERFYGISFCSLLNQFDLLTPVCDYLLLQGKYTYLKDHISWDSAIDINREFKSTRDLRNIFSENPATASSFIGQALFMQTEKLVCTCESQEKLVEIFGDILDILNRFTAESHFPIVPTIIPIDYEVMVCSFQGLCHDRVVLSINEEIQEIKTSSGRRSICDVFTKFDFSRCLDIESKTALLARLLSLDNTLINKFSAFVKEICNTRETSSPEVILVKVACRIVDLNLANVLLENSYGYDKLTSLMTKIIDVIGDDSCFEILTRLVRELSEDYTHLPALSIQLEATETQEHALPEPHETVEKDI